ncbi:GSCFA domain-containing protein [Altibacter sp.]|uniref:GSCFA domain-containing protein n=1 Tax=Altibacter sp. TaxID=2024823 RepID=UPI0025826F1E|nr:GSCFA domain-containing protein [Altibacter sp.]MCW9036634.1 GSCFA domain-containing protein [Altibacter sp.]
MKLFTHIPLAPEENPITYDSNLLLMGSCFTENIGGKLDYFKFHNVQNPFGIVFHPVAIDTLIARALDERPYTEEDIFLYNEQWHCFEVHSRLSHPNKEDLLITLNTQRDLLKKTIFSATHIILTLGTAWVYRYLENETIVANCHKIPQRSFAKELLSVSHISEVIRQSIDRIQTVNPKARILFTVSPVRHLKDGFAENSRSKAHLIAGLHAALDTRTNAFYFPSYELMQDEMRDYRFYAQDLIHPNVTAIELLWERFKDVWIASETENVQKEVDAIQKGLQHRPFHQDGAAYEAFQKNLQKKILQLEQRVPGLKF